MILPEIAIKRPVLTLMAMVAIVVFGVISFLRLGVDQFPQVDFPVVTVTTVLEGAAPEVVEENITDVIEEEVATIEGIRTLTSVSSHGASVVTVEFQLGRDIDIAAQDVRDRVNRVVKDLPRDIESPVIDKLDMASQPIMWLGVSGRRPIAEITAYAEDILKPRIETITGVGSILVGGRRERTVRVWLDRERLEAHDLSSADVVSALERENVEIPGGFLVSEDVEFSVKTEGEFEEVSGFDDLIIAHRKGTPVRLRDVGYVEDGLEDYRNLARYKGEPAVGLGIKKKAGANTVAVARAVKVEVERAQKILPAGVSLEVAFDSSVFIEESAAEMQFSLVFGGVLAALVVFLFLRNFRATIITAVTIPLAIIGTFIVIYFLGFTLNTMTMLALTLAIGIVIDDAIVIIDNIHRHRELGEGPKDAARIGASELAFAAIATTFALGAVFIPVAFMEGIIGRFFFEFGITVAVAVFLSTAIALTVTPMLSSKLFTRRVKTHGFLYSIMESFYKGLESAYRRLLGVALRFRWLVVLLALCVFASSIFAWQGLGKEFMPAEDASAFMVSFQTPVGSSIGYTNEKLKLNEKTLADIPEIRSFFAAIGLGLEASVNKGIMFVRMHPKHERTRSQQDIVGELRATLNQEPGWTNFVIPFAMGFGGSGRGMPLEFIIRGPTLEGLSDYTDEIVRRFEKVPGIVGVDTNFDLGLPELSVIIDRDRAADLGVDTTAIASTINTLIGGRDVTTFKESGRRYDVRVKLIDAQTTTPRDIERLRVRSKDGALVSLAGMVNVVEGVSPSVINRHQRQRSITVFSSMEPGKTLGSALDDIAAIAEEVLPDGYSTTLSGRAEQFKESFVSMVMVFALAILITYMVLAAQFESLVHPFTVMIALPLSIVGALGALYFTGNTINIYSLIGITLLVGLVTKNSILLVDYTNTLRQRGLGIREAVLEAGPVRLRPIVMTALSTMLGVLPTAIGVGPGSESRAPMAIAVIGGLFLSTLLTLFVVPVVYTLLDDLGRIVKRKPMQEDQA